MKRGMGRDGVETKRGTAAVTIVVVVTVEVWRERKGFMDAVRASQREDGFRVGEC